MPLLQDSFTIHYPDHMRAYKHMLDHGVWPEWILDDYDTDAMSSVMIAIKIAEQYTRETYG